ncbi:MAG TPA: tetratricopeptide repeat protein [Puia sp.]|nr:tetratricopeptide repeat protein [Puia sp.]
MKNLLFKKKTFVLALFFFSFHCMAQRRTEDGSTSSLSYGVVMDDPAMKEVLVQKDITYLKDDKGSLHIDIYSPPKLKTGERRPAIIFLNAIGETEGEAKVKSWGIYSSWPKLIAAQGYIGISMETDGARISGSIEALFDFLASHAENFHIDENRLGVYAASANVGQSLNYLMSDKAYPGIRAAVLYYGFSASGPFRKDLPVFFVISEGDARRFSYRDLWNEVLKNNAPWTIRMGTGMPHAFDAYSDNDDARRIIKETISFWKTQLETVTEPMFPRYRMRDVFGLLRIDQEKGLKILDSVVSHHPDDVKLLLLYANVSRETGKKEQATAMYQKVLKQDPGNTEALIQMAALSYSNNDAAEAENYIASIEKSGKMNANVCGNLGFLLLVADKNPEAAKYYEKAVALRPNGHDFYNLGCAYAKCGEKEKAFAAIEKSLELGYASKQLIENDTDFASLRNDERFKALVEKAK